ncbi:TetR family transcriptional regulator [Nocardia sp. NPDC052566]|uniref:TetR/AcrR family transcriptional regulator n=1 Tax=Nocardia sp. NPDC052566 TaxID=3364330 RepID=UPI0037CA02D2
MPASSSADRSLPLRERKKLRTRRTLADVALRMFTEKGFDATTLDEVVDEAEVSRSTFFRVFPAKEAVAIEAETELWSSYLTALAERELSGLILTELCDTLIETAEGLAVDWTGRYIATRKLALAAPAVLAYIEHYRTGVEKQVAACLAEKLGLEPGDLRLQVLAELTTTAWSVTGREWIQREGAGGRPAFVDRLREAFVAIPASLDLSAGGRAPSGAQFAPTSAG